MFRCVILFSMKSIFNKKRKKTRSLSVISIYKKNRSQNVTQSLKFVLFYFIFHIFYHSHKKLFLILVLPKRKVLNLVCFRFWCSFFLKENFSESKFPISFYKLWQQNGKKTNLKLVMRNGQKFIYHFYWYLIFAWNIHV